MIHSSPLSIGGWFNSSLKSIVICDDKTQLTRQDVLNRVAWLQSKMRLDEVKSCALYTDDTTLFLATFLACACTGVTLILPANSTDDFVQAVDADCYIGDWPDAMSVDFSGLKTLMPKHLGESFAVDVYTSGSTGDPKRISRSIQQLLAEVYTLQHTFAQSYGLIRTGGIFAATVSHQHIYGLLFKILWPLLTGQILWHKTIVFEESLEALLAQYDRVVLISSPAFLKRIHSQITTQGQLLKVYSSGGMLSDEEQQSAEKKLSTKITQVYGSTETGGIAHRSLKQKWQLFSQVSAQIKNQMLWVNSPFCYQKGWFCTEDKIKVSDNGFELMGRNDQVVKIEEKRVSLNQVEKVLRDHRYIADAAVIGLENGRQYLGAVIVLNKGDQHQVKSLGELKLKQDIKHFLATKLDAVAIPRKIIFTTDALENPQGKRVMHQLKQRFISS